MRDLAIYQDSFKANIHLSFLDTMWQMNKLAQQATVGTMDVERQHIQLLLRVHQIFKRPDRSAVYSDYKNRQSKILPPFQIIRCFSFSRYVVFAMYLDIHYVQIHTKDNISRKAKTSYNLGWREYVTRYIITVEIIQN